MPPVAGGMVLTEWKGGGSIGRVAVSKTDGWGFESLSPCQFFLSKPLEGWQSG